MSGIINVNNNSTSLAVTSTAARVLLPITNCSNIRVSYTGTDICFLESGDVTVTAATASPKTFLNGTGTEVFSMNPNHTYISAVSTGSGGTLYIQQSTGE